MLIYEHFQPNWMSNWKWLSKDLIFIGFVTCSCLHSRYIFQTPEWYTILWSHIFLVPRDHWLYVCLHLKMEVCSCARRLQYCGIFHYQWWTASIKPSLLFSHSGHVSCELPFLQFNKNTSVMLLNSVIQERENQIRKVDTFYLLSEVEMDIAFYFF